MLPSRLAALTLAVCVPALPIHGQTGGDVPTVHVDATPGHAIDSFDPDRALGSSIDVLSRTEIDKVRTSSKSPFRPGISLFNLGAVIDSKGLTFVYDSS
jgi:hypothetical protein